ncbi:HAD family hydrolase [Pseudoalteromonas fenneropenaei]|uniref:HAD family hydrolase n=1 Tax=Pseudoalteromonas fenneropenaei TaxID=1737459 RepID=A0ABV7CNP2_9GAMM
MTLQRPKAVLFDLDGTLLDTAPDLKSALNEILAAESLPEVEEQEFRPAVSDGAIAMLTVGFGNRLANYDVAALRKRYLALYEQIGCRDSRLFTGISLLLSALAEQDIQVAIVTNKPTFLTLPLLKQLPELSQIPVVVCGDTLAVSKPHPEPLLHAAAQLKIAAQECWYVGDADRDVAAAKAAGMQSIVAMWGYIPSASQAYTWQADHYATNPEALIHKI